MRKDRIHVPSPGSKFVLVQCTNCGNEQAIFSSVTMDVKCQVCENILAEKTGGKAIIHGVELRRLD